MRLATKEIAVKKKIGLDAKKSLAEVHKDGDLGDSIGVQMNPLETIKIENVTKEVGRGRAKPHSAKWVKRTLSPVNSKGKASVPAGRHSNTSQSWSSSSTTSRIRSFSVHLLLLQTVPTMGKHDPSTFPTFGAGRVGSLSSLLRFPDLIVAAYLAILDVTSDLLMFARGLRRGAWEGVDRALGKQRKMDLDSSRTRWSLAQWRQRGGFSLCRCKQGKVKRLRLKNVKVNPRVPRG